MLLQRKRNLRFPEFATLHEMPATTEWFPVSVDSALQARQVFFFSIFRLSVMSLRLSKLETVRVLDFAPSFSACSS